MKRLPITSTLLAATTAVMLAASVGVARAAESPANDCLIGVQDEDHNQLSGTINCTDGAACDADGATDGQCLFKIRGCINIPGVSGCDLRPIKRAKFKTQNAKNLIVVRPVTDSTSSVCGSFVDFTVKLKKHGKKLGKRKIIATVTTDTRPKAKDKDKALFTCNPCTDPSGDCSGNGSTTTTTIPPSSCANPTDGPDQLTVTVGDTGNDLDTGFTGQSHNFLNVSGAQLKYCLTGCDASNTSQCQASGATGNGTLNGPTFGPPLPLFSAGVAVCVVNRFQENSIGAVVDVATGAFDASATPLRLLSDTYQASASQVCPRCVNGNCDSGRNQGQNCTVDGSVVVNNPPNVNNVTYNVSKSCLPSQANLLGTPNVVLPLTTQTSTLAGNAAGNFPCPSQTKHDECGGGSCSVDCSAKQDAKGGINQTCCTNAAQTPCFPTDPADGGSLSRTGTPSPITPAWPDPNYPKSGEGTLAATFCIPATSSITVDATAGLPGPGAVLIHGTATYSKAP